MNAALIRQLVWLDYRLALIFTAIAPMILLIWALRGDSLPIKRSLLLYWRVASMVLITIYLAIGNLGASFISGILANILIILALWFWRDLNEDINASRHNLKPIYLGWRWAVSFYCVLAGIFRLVFANCAFVSSDRLSNICKIWFEPPTSFAKMFSSVIAPENLAFAGVVAGLVYMLYLSIFLVFSLPKNGRVAFRD